MQEATRIGGDDGFCLGGKQLFYFAIAKLTGGLRIQKVVDTGGTAAQAGLFDLNDLQARNVGEETARLLVDGLRMTEVAGVVISDAHRQGMARGLGGQVAKNLGDILALRTEGCGAGRPDGIITEDMTVLFHRRTAPRRIDNDGVHVGRFKGGDHLASQVSCLIFETGMDHEGAAAGLRLRNQNLTAFRGEDAGCGLVDVLEEYLLDTAGEYAHSASRRVGGSNMGWNMFEQVGRNPREKRFHCGHTFWKKP